MTFLEFQEYMQNSQRSGYAFLADIEKTFDSIFREFLERSLKSLNFDVFFISWFITLLADSKARLIINNFLSPIFAISSGVRQGCPWAPLLFITAIESLACTIRSSDIGIKVGDLRIAYLRIADDTCCYASSLSHISEVLNIFENFEKASGLKMNQGKSTIIPFGSSVSQLKPDNIPCKWLSSTDHERFLGIDVSSIFSQDQP
jgi:hypothetical protein